MYIHGSLCDKVALASLDPLHCRNDHFFFLFCLFKYCCPNTVATDDAVLPLFLLLLLSLLVFYFILSLLMLPSPLHSHLYVQSMVQFKKAIFQDRVIYSTHIFIYYMHIYRFERNILLYTSIVIYYILYGSILLDYGLCFCFFSNDDTIQNRERLP